MSDGAPRGLLVLGHPRSGTTLLRRLLNGHSAIAAPPETHLFSACARFLESDHTADGVDMGVLAGLHFAGVEDAEVISRLRDFAFGFLDRYAAAHNKTRWAEKTAFDVFYLDGIERLCGDELFYVGILRHPFDVAVSCKEFCDSAGVYPAPMHTYIQRYPQPVEAFVRSWVDTTKALIALGERRSSRCMICRYEDLVADPESTLDHILSFIGEKSEPGLTERALDDVDTLGFSDHKSYQTKIIHEDSVARWQSLPRPQIDRLAPLVNPLLERCGYDPVEAGAPLSLDDKRRRYTMGLAVSAGRRGDD
jgi:hypothetical protein